MATKIRIIGPVVKGLVRVELDVTYRDLITVSTFDPTAFVVEGKKDEGTVFQLVLGGEPRLGSMGVSIPEGTLDDKVQEHIDLSGLSEEALFAVVSRATPHLAKLETQIKKALTAYAKVREEVEVL